MKIVCIILFCASSILAQQVYFPPVNSESWDTVSTQSLGWCNDKLEDLKNYLKESNSKAFIILKDGRIAVEWYFDSFTKDSIWYWASAGKSLTSFLIGKAQEEGFLNIEDRTSKYLGTGWTSLPTEKEALITIRHQLTMTTGLDDNVSNPDCTSKSCLQFKADAGTRWAYHNAPYTLLGKVIENSAKTTKNLYTKSKVGDKIGMKGLWLVTGDNEIYYSNARSMARYGLLISNNAVWGNDTILYDRNYMYQILNTSQELNKSYGYLWWLNGKGSYMAPGSQILFRRDLMPSAPDDLVAALGKNDQRIYIVKSLGLVVVRLGNSSETLVVMLSSLDNGIWERISKLSCNSTSVFNSDNLPEPVKLYQNYPNPFNPETTIKYYLPESGHVALKIYDILGREVASPINEFQTSGLQTLKISTNEYKLASGIYFYTLFAKDNHSTKKMLILR